MCIFAEGATSNGTSITQFKKGAFASLRAVQPVVLQYKTATKIRHSIDVAGFLYHTLISWSQYSVTMKTSSLPNFEPNEYFWKHHWQEGKEEKWEAFARVVRQIMCDYGGMKMSNLQMEDKFAYIKELKALQK